MGHFSPVPPGERTYAKNYRKELAPLEAQLVEVSGRCKEFKDHQERKDLQSLLLVNITVRLHPKGKIIRLAHLWVLTKHVKRVGIEPRRGRRMKFIGSVYAYFRLGGKSKQRGLLASHDFSILPMVAPDIETFEPGINTRYETQDTSSDTGRPRTSKEENGDMGAGAPSGPKDTHRRRRNNRSPESGSEDGDSKHLPHKHSRKARPKRSRKPRKTDSDGKSENPRD